MIDLSVFNMNKNISIMLQVDVIKRASKRKKERKKKKKG